MEKTEEGQAYLARVALSQREQPFPWTIKDCKEHITRVTYFKAQLEEVFIKEQKPHWYEDKGWRNMQDELSFWRIKMHQLKLKAEKRQKTREENRQRWLDVCDEIAQEIKDNPVKSVVNSALSPK